MRHLEEFEYLGNKIEQASFKESPFAHLYIENFLSDEHFESVINQKQIKLPVQQTTKGLIKMLEDSGWQIQLFPGCTLNINEYLRCYEKNEWPVDKKRLEGFGLAFRLKRYDNEIVSRLVEYLNSRHFKGTIEHKFKISRPNRIETAIQKYLSGYEICPHPDARHKCLTYLININTDQRSEALSIHTHLQRFKNEKRFIYDFWKYNEKFETDWVPWEWCSTETEVRKNNSLLMFAPSWDTLHAVKLRYDHLLFQRTQLYGNLWYTDTDPFFLSRRVGYDQFDIKPQPLQTYSKLISSLARRWVFPWVKNHD